jgi:hypothetical protein
MDRPNSNIIIIDENKTTLREQILSKIIAAALLEQIQLHNTNIPKKSNKTMLLRKERDYD